MIERVADRARLNNRNDVEEALNTTILMNRPKAMYVRMSSDMRHIDIYDIRNGRADFLERIDMFP
jgi:phage antirepressor YoqD-like protein